MAAKVGSEVPTFSYSHDRRDATATPLCGAHRQPKGNPLLVKPQLGTVKATAYDLPNDFAFTFGMRQERDGLTAGLVIENWAQHTGTKDKLPARDFTALNKAAVIDGNLTAKGVREYTKTHDIRVKVGGEQKQSPLPIDANTCFGKGVRPGTPFDDQLSHAFRYDWVLTNPLAENMVDNRKAVKPKSTAASRCQAAGSRERSSQQYSAQLGFPTPPDSLDLWKIGKFHDLPAKVGYTGQ